MEPGGIMHVWNGIEPVTYLSIKKGKGRAKITQQPMKNARVFSMVGLNKTSTRNSLSLNGTLASIMTLKMAGLEPNCFKWEPTTQKMKDSKKATNTYNKQHQS